MRLENKFELSVNSTVKFTHVWNPRHNADQSINQSINQKMMTYKNNLR